MPHCIFWFCKYIKYDNVKTKENIKKFTVCCCPIVNIATCQTAYSGSVSNIKYDNEQTTENSKIFYCMLLPPL
jgi:hypothetical protein